MRRFQTQLGANPDFQQVAQAADQGAAAARQASQQLPAVRADYETVKAELARQQRDFETLRNLISRLEVTAGRTGIRGGEDMNIQRVENIPGRRIPFDYTVDVAIAAGTTQMVQGTIPISQDGPFIAVARYATFNSAYQFRYVTPGSDTGATFNGRSWGRYRPVHSTYDMNDGQPVAAVAYAQAFPGTGAPHIVSPSNQSSFRSMEMDFRIKMFEQGSTFPRSYLEVPSSLWVKGLGEPFPLGALDFFERGQVISFNIIPLHVANPAFGNISGFASGFSDFPFIDSQWDAIEGINDQAQDIGETDTDPVTRLPNGILTIGFTGYRIIQPAGAGQY